jgi:hypothetical protein
MGIQLKMKKKSNFEFKRFNLFPKSGIEVMKKLELSSN